MVGVGEQTDIVKEWSEFDGIPVPSKVVALFEGDPYMNAQTSEYVLDGDVDMTIFEKGE
jgi:hypothetical protein